MSEQVVVETKNLTKRYGEFVALDSLTIRLEQRQILGFIGPNGAGKTTTIKILVGLSKPTEGSATVCGLDCTKDVAALKKVIGYMPDTFGAYDNMRVQEYLDFFGAAFKIPRKDRQKQIGEVMEIAGAGYMKDRYVESLSHGMKQRVGIARTLMHNPQVLILDEPANGLDPQARIEMRELILRLSDMGKTIIVTSHILPELSRICNVVAIVTKGKLRAFGSLDDIMRQVRQRRVIEAQLLSVGDVDRASDIIRKRLETDAEVTQSKTEAVVRFATQKGDEELAGILMELTKQGISLAQFREQELDLEDAFLSVTRNEKGGSGDREPMTVGGKR